MSPRWEPRVGEAGWSSEMAGWRGRFMHWSCTRLCRRAGWRRGGGVYRQRRRSTRARLTVADMSAPDGTSRRPALLYHARPIRTKLATPGWRPFHTTGSTCRAHRSARNAVWCPSVQRNTPGPRHDDSIEWGSWHSHAGCENAESAHAGGTPEPRRGLTQGPRPGCNAYGYLSGGWGERSIHT